MNPDLKHIFEDIEAKEKGLVCDGLLFRGFSSTYYHDGTIGRKEGIRLLKRQSCKGGDDCKSWDGEDFSTYCCDTWFLEEMNEMLPDGVIIPDIEDGALYRIRVVNETYDFESGYCDGFDFEFYKVEEDENRKKDS